MLQENYFTVVLQSSQCTQQLNFSAKAETPTPNKTVCRATDTKNNMGVVIRK